jgi:hypothetical protein
MGGQLSCKRYTSGATPSEGDRCHEKRRNDPDLSIEVEDHEDRLSEAYSWTPYGSQQSNSKQFDQFRSPYKKCLTREEEKFVCEKRRTVSFNLPPSENIDDLEKEKENESSLAMLLAELVGWEVRVLSCHIAYTLDLFIVFYAVCRYASKAWDTV